MKQILTLHEARRRSTAGFTLIELMVALVMSLLLVVAMLKMQSTMARQTVRNADAGVRDESWRMGINEMTRSISGAGFLLGGTQKPCNEMFTYNSAATSASKFFTHHAVDSVAASNGLKLPFALGLSLTYPPAGSTMPSDVLVVTTSDNASGFNDNDNTGKYVSGFSNAAYTPVSTGLIPVQTTTGLQQTDIGILQVGLTNRIACIRTPLKLFGTANGSANIQTSGTTLTPPGFYNDYAPSLATAGYPALTNASIFQGQIVDMSPTPTARTTVFYIDQPAAYTFPVLMRTDYGFKDDVATNTQVLAAGVVSLQVLYGVDPGLTGSVNPVYETAATVTASNHWDVVRTVKVLLVTVSLTDDMSRTEDGQGATLTIPTGFAAVPILTTPIDYSKRHYTVNQFEVAERNVLWNCAFSTVCVP